LVGAGGISAAHLDAYAKAGFDVRVIASRNLDRARERRDRFAPQAEATDDIAGTLRRPDIDVVDLTPHPAGRVALMQAALEAGKHVLSQKPFATDLATAERLVALARRQGVRLAVNQNGRWAPHLSWMREAVRAGLVGEVTGCHVAIRWNHMWIAGTPFEDVHDLVLYDFGIHWFDFTVSLLGDRIREVFATATRASGQNGRPPLLAQALVSFEGGQASLVFDGATRCGALDTTSVVGTRGSLRSEGPDLGRQVVTLSTDAGEARPELAGTWFNDGFAGTMGELLSAIEEGREPLNGAEGNIAALALTFAAVESSRTGRPVRPGAAPALPRPPV
jgi:predicted dehydrogenase